MWLRKKTTPQPLKLKFTEKRTCFLKETFLSFSLPLLQLHGDLQSGLRGSDKRLWHVDWAEREWTCHLRSSGPDLSADWLKLTAIFLLADGFSKTAIRIGPLSHSEYSRASPTFQDCTNTVMPAKFEISDTGGSRLIQKTNTKQKLSRNNFGFRWAD